MPVPKPHHPLARHIAALDLPPCLIDGEVVFWKAGAWVERFADADAAPGAPRGLHASRPSRALIERKVAVTPSLKFNGAPFLEQGSRRVHPRADGEIRPVAGWLHMNMSAGGGYSLTFK